MFMTSGFCIIPSVYMLVIPAGSLCVTMGEHKANLERDHIKEMMASLYCFALGMKNKALRKKQIFARLCVLKEKCASSWKLFCISDAMQSFELKLFTFDFHFKEFFVTGMLIKLTILSDFDLYSYVLITAIIRWLRDVMA